jgi:hypothetical protein
MNEPNLQHEIFQRVKQKPFFRSYLALIMIFYSYLKVDRDVKNKI